MAWFYAPSLRTSQEIDLHHTSKAEALVNRAAIEVLFNDLMRLEEMLENIQNLNQPGKIHLVIIMAYTLTISLLQTGILWPVLYHGIILF